MTCSADSFSGEQIDGRFVFRNWLGNVVTPVGSFFRPDSLESLVFVVQEAHRNRHRVRVVGSGWSFEDIAASPDWMIDIGQLNTVTNLRDDALTARSFLTLAWQRRISNDSGSSRLVHVEAGVQIFDLNRQLHDMRLAMPTLGGSQGQTLAGAISTSTHGGDVGQPPLPDIVRAVHLVTNDGQELWVESSSTPLTTDARLRAKLSCPDVQIVRDDALLRALQVSVGRFGVIYAYVIEVTTPFGLAELTTPHSWAEIASLLREGIAAGSLFEPLRLALPSPTLAGIVIPAGEATSRPRPRYLEYIINPRSPNDLWVRRRWMIRPSPRLVIPDSAGAPDHAHTLATAVAVLMGAAAAIQSIIPTVSFMPGYGLVRALEMQIRVAELNGIALEHGLTVERALVASMNALWACDDLHVFGPVIEELVHSTFNGRPEFTSGTRRGVSWQITSGLDAGNPNQARVNSLEVTFDATTTNYIDYLDLITERGRDYRQAGYLSVRYSRSSDALLSMHNVPGSVAVTIEIVSLVGFDGNSDWLRFAEERAIAMGGRPHWGQQNNLQEHQVEDLYGDLLRDWREQLLNVVGTSSTFSNHYTQQRGLEPSIVAFREVTAVRREGGRITHLCNPSASWSPLPVEDFIRDYSAERAFRVGAPAFAASRGIMYVTRPSDLTIPPAHLTVRNILSTSPDDVTGNNLSALPACPRLLFATPSPSSTRRRVTSVIRNRWGGIEYLCNEAEGWKVFDSVAFLEIANGTIEYFIDRDGAETDLVARTHITTWADSRPDNNLDSLPDC